jgi:GNAT superfamily N-acetyltransferase
MLAVVIAKEHRGKGWGKYLMLATEDYAIRYVISC